MRRLLGPTAVALAATAFAASTAGAIPRQASQGESQEATYVVLYDEGTSTSAGAQAVAAAGGTVTEVNTAVGLATVTTTNPDFVRDVDAQAGITGAAKNISIGSALPTGAVTAKDRSNAVETDTTVSAGGVGATAVGGTEPLSANQWDMEMIHAFEAAAVHAGTHKTRVGIIDTGIDGSHPDIAPNFNAALSRNFTTDIPLIDGECADDPDGSCEDPADVDESGHGTHVASTIGSPINGLGIQGVAPGVELVNLRAGQDSGYFFLQESVDALTYAGDNGIDVVNMSYFIDPWLYNCAANPADSAEEQAEQRTIIEATQRALRYAHKKGVTLVAALGNQNTDIGNPTFDNISPDYPPGTEKERTVDNSCITLPTEGNHVIGVSSVGPSGRKAYYSNWGTEQTDVSAPGGDRREFFGTPQYGAPATRILAAYPEVVGRRAGTIDPAGNPTTPLVVKDCSGGPCAYYQYIQGTSMASPHAAGVAALIVSRWGHKDNKNGGVTLNPQVVDNVIRKGATDTPCPPGGVTDYPDLPEEFTATCVGSPDRNGFYGDGVVNALKAVTSRSGT